MRKTPNVNPGLRVQCLPTHTKKKKRKRRKEIQRVLIGAGMDRMLAACCPVARGPPAGCLGQVLVSKGCNTPMAGR